MQIITVEGPRSRAAPAWKRLIAVPIRFIGPPFAGGTLKVGGAAHLLGRPPSLPEASLPHREKCEVGVEKR